MSVHQFGRRVPVPPQAAQHLQPTVLPAPTRGLCLSENDAFMQPGGAMVLRQLGADHARRQAARRLIGMRLVYVVPDAEPTRCR